MILDEIHLLGADRGPILEVLSYNVLYPVMLLVAQNLILGILIFRWNLLRY